MKSEFSLTLSPVPELSFLPAPYRGTGSAPIWSGKKVEFRDWTSYPWVNLIGL